MTKKVKNNELFSYVNSALLTLFKQNEYPWETLKHLKEWMDEILKTAPHAFSFYKDDVLIGEGVKIHPNAVIEGPAVICENTEIRMGAYIRGYVFCGENCVIGNSTELKHSILLNRVQVPHYNYVGDSILGYKSHLGAGCICSNLKSDGQNVVVHGEEDHETGMRKFGCAIGDFCEIGCNCVLNPGTIVGKSTSVYPLTSLRGVYPADCIVKRQNEFIRRK